ncbi:MAG: FKBP-type peptidyl-prolyl cis-trans isomerase [Bacteroidota bacterium]|nr:FKBP-type peptidyl-prolyl cis-trans isomerase [Bacteroidota bacterium]
MAYRVAILFFILVFYSCNDPKEKKQTNSNNEISEKKVKDLFVKANQQVVQKENDEMDYYVKSHKLPFIKTNSGIRYFVYKPSAKGDSIKEGEEIKMNFTLSLLSGTECYSSKQEGPKTFIVGHEDIESGIHKGVQFLKHGDKALFLIPSHLAHGLLGDFKKIPPQTPIIYDVEIF